MEPMPIPASYLDRLNPNLVVILHYLSKVSWLVLAALFGLVGYKLYAIGIQTTGSTTVNLLGISFSLKNAGPGLTVMMFALACSVIGSIRSKIEFLPTKVTISAPQKTDPSPEPARELATQEVLRECKLFGQLLHYLAEGSPAFVILNSLGRIDLESVSWSAIPEDVQKNAVLNAANWMSSDKTLSSWSGSIGEWNVRRTLVVSPAQRENPGKTSSKARLRLCVVSLDPRPSTVTAATYLKSIIMEDTRPLVLDT
jgi:hypothetical protein